MLFDEYETAQIVQERTNGLYYKEIAARHYCSTGTIKNYLFRAGYITKKKYKTPVDKINLIAQDWNAGEPAKKIRQKYRFSSTDAVFAFASKYRRRGYDFSYRRVS